MTEGELEKLRKQVLSLAADLDDIKVELRGADGTDTDGLVGTVNRLDSTLHRVFEMVETDPGDGAAAEEVATDPDVLDAEADEEEAARTVSVAWVDLGPERASAVLRETAAWVYAVAPHQLTRLNLMTCWPQHPEVVQVLIDARAYWHGLYRSDKGGLWMLVDWHLRHWPDWAKALEAAQQTCRSNREHSAPKVAKELKAITNAALDEAAATWTAREMPRPPGAEDE